MSKYVLAALFTLVWLGLGPGAAAGQSRFAIATETNPRILNPSFQVISPELGLWRGHLTGSGLAQLELRIMRRGQIVQRRSVGSVQLVAGERPVSFHFRAPLPAGRDWTWQLVAANSSTIPR